MDIKWLNSIGVLVRVENKDELLSRLLRYDKYCEILQPRKYRIEMKEILNKMLENYGE